jgi:hypothetical protein
MHWPVPDDRGAALSPDAGSVLPQRDAVGSIARRTGPLISRFAAHLQVPLAGSRTIASRNFCQAYQGIAAVSATPGRTRRALSRDPGIADSGRSSTSARIAPLARDQAAVDDEFGSGDERGVVTG